VAGHGRYASGFPGGLYHVMARGGAATLIRALARGEV
jgi:hypothetical protein